MKKRVGIIYFGQMRANSLNPNYACDNKILDSTFKYLLNNEFNKKYDYDIFFSTDIIDVEKAKETFGEHLKNINITETTSYLNPIEYLVLPYENFKEKYLKTNFMGCDTHVHILYSYYRMYCCYNLLKNHQKQTGATYDYLIKIRPDSLLMQDTMPLFNILETTNKQIIMEHAHFAIMKYELEDIFKLIEKYGIYNESISIRYNLYASFLSRTNNFGYDNVMIFSPEKQFTDHIYYTILSKNMDFNESFLGLVYPSFQILYRGNSKYAHINDDHPIYTNPDYVWEPFTKITL